MDSRFSIWLLPAGELLVTLSAHIRRIGAALGSPAYLPHVTVLSDVSAARAVAERSLAEIAPVTAPLLLTPRGIATSSDRFQALTIRFHLSAAFDSLAAALRARL